MSNGYTAIPNIIPGDVTIGGNLLVNGNTVRIGAVSPFVRLGKLPTHDFHLTHNLNAATGTPDDNTKHSFDQMFLTDGTGPQIKRLSTTGSFATYAEPECLDVVDTHIVKTGSTSELTVWTATLVGKIMPTNSAVRLRILLNITALTAGGPTIRFRMGGTAVDSAVPGSTGLWELEWLFANRNATGSQYIRQRLTKTGVATTFAETTSGVDTTIDQTLTLTSQAANAADSVSYDHFEVTLLNAGSL